MILLLHGVGLDRRMWSRCRLPGAVAPDLPGHGSAAPAPPDTTLADLSADVAERMSGPAHVVGFSLGALVAQHLAVTRPELVRSLTLVSSVAGRSAGESAAVAGRLAEAAHDFPATARAAVDRWMSPAWRAEEPELAEQLLATLLGNDVPSYLACYRVFATADAELWPLLPRISAPTLAITGADDRGSTPAMTHALAAAIPNARAVVVPGARHLLPLEHPERLTDEILALTAEVEHGTARPLHRR
jgi:pimeloyl-ACP methyl ester carboxylesterase